MTREIPIHLVQYISEQEYDLYSAIDHACWRFIMRISMDFFKEHAHKKYIDVQFILKGSELMGYAPFKGQEIVSEYNEEKDVILFSGNKSFFKIEYGMFAIFFPYELHMPGIKAEIPENVKKVVIKVKA